MTDQRRENIARALRSRYIADPTSTFEDFADAVIAAIAADDLRSRVLALADEFDTEAQSEGYRVSPAAATTLRYAAAMLRAAVDPQ